MRGFSFIELMTVIGIIILVLAISLPVFIEFDRQYKLNSASDLLADNLISAREKTIASSGSSQYGVYLEQDKYTLFKGENYAARDTLSDHVVVIPQEVEIFEISSPEIIFDRISGSSSPSHVSLRLASSPARIRSVYIDALGQVSQSPFPASSDDDRVKDSRHAHFNYLRIVDVSEIMTISLNEGSSVIILSISDNIQGGGFSWTGTVLGQTLSIKTKNGLDNPEFCIIRDGRENDQSLKIYLSGDATGSLAEYSADGLATSHHSIYVQNFTWE